MDENANNFKHGYDKEKAFCIFKHWIHTITGIPMKNSRSRPMYAVFKC